MAGAVAEGGRGGAVEGGRGGAVEEVGVVGYLRRPCLSFCRICNGMRSCPMVAKDSIFVMETHRSNYHFLVMCATVATVDNVP